jgi:hypothetical protein
MTFVERLYNSNKENVPVHTDIDECVENAGICEEGACVNTDGGVICECPEGYILSRDGVKCIDVREELCYDEFYRG